MVSWSLSALDKVFSNLRLENGEQSYPESTQPAGFTMDSWGEWKMVCLSVLEVEDVEDVYIFGLQVVGYLLIGAGGYLMYRQILKLWIGWAATGNTWTKRLGDLDRRLDAASEQYREQLAVILERYRECRVRDSKLADGVLELNRKLAALLDLNGRSGATLEKLQFRLGVEK